MSDRWSFPQEDEDKERERAELRARVLQINAAGSGALPLEEALEVLRNEEAPAAVRRAVLTRCDIPVEVIAEARWMEDASVRAFAMSLPGTSVDELRWASADIAWQVRVEVAQHPVTPIDLLVRLAGDSASMVRRAVIARPDLPTDVLVEVIVAGTSRLDAQIALSQPSLVVSDHLDRLLEAREFGALALLELKSVPRSLLRRFAMADHPPSVREAALRRGAPRASAVAALRARDESVRLAAIEGGNCSPVALARAVDDPSDIVRAAVAACPKTPTDAVDGLMHDYVDSVRLAAAASPAASPEALARTALQDPAMDVRERAVTNEHCPPDAIGDCCHVPELVVAAASNPNCPVEGLVVALVTLRDAERTRPPGVDENSPAAKRAALVATAVKQARRTLGRRRWAWLQLQPLDELHPDDLAALLRRHLGSAATDPRVGVRIAVATHKDVDDATLVLLAEDPDDAVRHAVTMRILGAAGGTVR